MHRPGEQLLVLVVHRHHDEQLGPSRRIVQDLPQGVLFVLEIVRIARRGGVPQMRDLAIRPIGAHVQQFGRNGTIEHQVTVIQADFFHRLVPSRNPLRDPSISNVGLFGGSFRWVDEPSWLDARTGITSSQQRHIAQVLMRLHAIVFQLIRLPDVTRAVVRTRQHRRATPKVAGRGAQRWGARTRRVRSHRSTIAEIR